MLLSGISPILSAVWICGGTPEFGQFAAKACKGEVAATETVREIRFGSATNDVFIILPRYGQGESTLAGLPEDFWNDVWAAAQRGCRTYLENVALPGQRAREVACADPYGTDPMPFDRECIEWSDEILQARNASYLPVRNRSVASVQAWVSDCFGAG